MFLISFSPTATFSSNFNDFLAGTHKVSQLVRPTRDITNHFGDKPSPTTNCTYHEKVTNWSALDYVAVLYYQYLPIDSQWIGLSKVQRPTKHIIGQQYQSTEGR